MKLVHFGETGVSVRRGRRKQPLLNSFRRESMKNKRRLPFTIVLCLLVTCGSSLFAQVTATANLEGTVLDKSQAIVRGAQVSIVNKATGDVRSAKSNDTGEY